MAASFFKIASTTISSATSTVELSSIPQTYNHLIVKISVRTTVSADNEYFNLRINNDSGLKYNKYTHYYNGGSSGMSSQAWVDQDYMYMYQAVGDTSTANVFSNHELFFSNYTSTENKPVLEESNSLKDTIGASGSLRMVTSSSMLWRPTTNTGITTLTFTTASGNFKVNSSFTLYGVKNS